MAYNPSTPVGNLYGLQVLKDLSLGNLESIHHLKMVGLDMKRACTDSRICELGIFQDNSNSRGFCYMSSFFVK